MAEAAAAAAAAPRPGPPASSWPLAALASQGKLRFSLSCKTAIEGFRDLYCKACLSGQACTERMDIDAWALRWKELVEAKGAIPDPASSDRHVQQALFPKVLEMLRFFADPKAKPAPRLALPHRATQEYWCAWARSRLAEDEGGWIVQAAKSGVQADELAALIAAGKGGVKAKRSADGGEAAGESESEASDKQARTSGSNAPHAPDAAAVADAATGGGEPVFREAPAPAPNGTGGRGPRPRWPEDGVPVVLEERRAKKKAAAAKERRTEASPDRDGSSASEASEDDDEEDGDAEEEVVVRKGVRRKTQEAKGKKAAKRKPGRPAKPSSKKRATAEVVATNQDEEGRARMPAAAAKDVTPPLVSSAPVKPVAAELPSPSKDSTATPMSKPAADAAAHGRVLTPLLPPPQTLSSPLPVLAPSPAPSPHAPLKENLVKVFHQLNLERLLPRFVKEEIFDVATAVALQDGDFDRLALPLGTRALLRQAFKEAHMRESML